MSTPQRWELAFKLPYHQLDATRTFEVFGYKLSLSPVENHSEGRLYFEMRGATIDKEKAKTLGMEWIQRKLIDSYLLGFGEDLKPEFSEPTLLNESELASLPTTIVKTLTCNATIRASLSIADIEKSLELTKKLEMHADKESLERSLRWFKKARDADDVVDGFIMRWIAFNSLYGMFDPDKSGDMIAIKNLINAHPSTAKIREILAAYAGTITNLASKELKDWHEQKNYSDELKDLIGKQDARSTLRVVGLCLFVVRSEVFHGGITPSQKMDFIRECSQLLDTIYRECFRSYVGLT